MLFTAGILCRTAAAGKLAGRECHVTEKVARAAWLLAGTLLIRYTVIGSGDQELGRPLDTEHGKQTKRDVKTVTILPVANAVHTALLQNILRDIVGRAAGIAIAAAAVTRLNDQGTKHHRLYRLYNGGGQIVRSFRAGPRCAAIGLGITAEDADVPLTAKQNNAFIHYGNTVKALRSAHAGAGLQLHMNIEACRDLIKATVELDGVDLDICPKDLCTDNTNRTPNVIQQLLAGIAYIHTGIFITISITARIQNAEGINADGLSSAGGGAARVAGTSVL